MDNLNDNNIFFNLINFQPWKFRNIYDLIYNNYIKKLDKPNLNLKVLSNWIDNIIELNASYNNKYYNIIENFQESWTKNIKNENKKINHYFRVLTNTLLQNLTSKKSENDEVINFKEKILNFGEDLIDKLNANFNLIKSFKIDIEDDILKLNKLFMNTNIKGFKNLENKIRGKITENNENIIILDKKNFKDYNNLEIKFEKKIIKFVKIINKNDKFFKLNEEIEKINNYNVIENKVKFNWMSKGLYSFLLNNMSIIKNIDLHSKINNNFKIKKLDYFREFLLLNVKIKNKKYLNEFYFITDLIFNNYEAELSTNYIINFKNQIRNDRNLLEVLYYLCIKYLYKNNEIILKNKNMIWLVKIILKTFFKYYFYYKIDNKLYNIFEMSFYFKYIENGISFKIIRKLNDLKIFKEKSNWFIIFECYLNSNKIEISKNITIFEKLVSYNKLRNENNEKNKWYALENIYLILHYIKLDYMLIYNTLLILCKRYSISSDDKFKIMYKRDYIINNQIMNFDNLNYYKNRVKCLNNNNINISNFSKIKLFINKVLYFWDSENILSFLFLNKEFKIIVYKHILVNDNFKLSENHRKVIYKEIVISKFNTEEDFNVDINYFKNNKSKNLIRMDVLRTYKEDKVFKHNNLILILLNIVDKDKNIEYFQGMNYLVGYFYKFFNFDILFTYKFCKNFLNKFYSNIISNKLENLNNLFFIISNIIKIKMPKLHRHFVKNKIEIEMFVTQWILTAFTTISQYNFNSLILMDLIDIFISESWIGFIKILITLLKKLELDLLNSNFDNILFILNNLLKKGFMIDSKDKLFNFKDYYDVINFNEEDFKYLFQEFLERKKKKVSFWNLIKEFKTIN